MADRTALVLAGAGARGAYEAGALRALYPAMVRDGSAPSLLFGTSAGALNAVALASLAHLPPKQAVDQLVAMWQKVELSQVAPVLSSVAGDALQGLRLFLGGHARMHSLLDTSRLAATVKPLIDWNQLHANVRDGVIAAVAVATTSAATQGTVVFVEAHPDVKLPPPDAARDIEYVPVELHVEHALASSAIPVAFRPVAVAKPESHAGWYLDGGTRLNVPIKPAIAFEARRVAVVSTHPATYPAGDPLRFHRERREPDIASAAAHLLRSLLGDRMVEDLHNLETVNRLVAQDGHADFKEVEFVFAGPSEHDAGAIGATAQRAFESDVKGLRGLLRNPSLWFLSRSIGGSPADHGELLSYLYFDPAFTGPAADLGTAHAGASIGSPLRWRTTF